MCRLSTGSCFSIPLLIPVCCCSSLDTSASLSEHDPSSPVPFSLSVSCGSNGRKAAGKPIMRPKQVLKPMKRSAQNNFSSLTNPIDHDRFQFGTCRTRCPREADDAEARREHLAKNRRVTISSGKIGVKPWMLPVRDSRHDGSLDVGDDVLPLFTFLRCTLR